MPVQVDGLPRSTARAATVVSSRAGIASASPVATHAASAGEAPLTIGTTVMVGHPRKTTNCFFYRHPKVRTHGNAEKPVSAACAGAIRDVYVETKAFEMIRTLLTEPDAMKKAIRATLDESGEKLAVIDADIAQAEKDLRNVEAQIHKLIEFAVERSRKGKLTGSTEKQFEATQRSLNEKHDALERQLRELHQQRMAIATPDDLELEERIDDTLFGLVDRAADPMRWSAKQKQAILDAFFGESSTRRNEYGIFLSKRAQPNGHMVYKLTMRGLFGEIASDGTGSASLPPKVLDAIAAAAEPQRPRIRDKKVWETVSRLFVPR